MEKQEIINKLEEYIDILKDDNTRLENIRISNTPDYNDLFDGMGTLKTTRTGDSFSIDFDVIYLGKK